MTQISVALVKKLREKTGAGMMDCKRALSETSADLEQAIDWLRKKGLSAAANKAGRVAAEGLVGVYAVSQKAAIVEVNAETDFVARNDGFQEFVSNVCKIVLEQGSELDAVVATPYPGNDRTVAEEVTHNIATIGENLSIRRCEFCSVEKGVIASYIHSAATPDLGRIGVLVTLESGGDSEKLLSLGKQIAMHIAAARPQWLNITDVDPATLDRERKVLSEQARASGRPDDVIEKMVEGRMRKYFEECVLLEQTFVIDNQTKIAKVLEGAEESLGTPIRISHFVRYALGEGIDREESDFAAEVAATLGN
jgi:elongation factor Ts